MLATALVVFATAGELGPFAPILVAGGFYMVVLGAVIYLDLATRALIGWLLKRHREREGDVPPTGRTAVARELPGERA